jgi:hypothetical protein
MGIAKSCQNNDLRFHVKEKTGANERQRARTGANERERAGTGGDWRELARFGAFWRGGFLFAPFGIAGIRRNCRLALRPPRIGPTTENQTCPQFSALSSGPMGLCYKGRLLILARRTAGVGVRHERSKGSTSGLWPSTDADERSARRSAASAETGERGDNPQATTACH